MPKRPRQDDIDPHKKDRTSRPAQVGTALLDRQGRVVVEPGGKLPASIQPRHETLAQKAVRLAAMEKAKRTAFVEGDDCTIALLKEHRFITGRVLTAGAVTVNVQPYGDARVLTFDLRTRREVDNTHMELFTQYEWERAKLFREEVLPKLDDLARDYKNAGDMTIEELKVLSAVLQLAIDQREGKR